MKEFRLVAYTNATESITFTGGRAAASPLAYYYHAQDKCKVFLGGSIVFQGLGKYHDCIKDNLEEKSICKLPLDIYRG